MRTSKIEARKHSKNTFACDIAVALPFESHHLTETLPSDVIFQPRKSVFNQEQCIFKSLKGLQIVIK